MAKTRPYYAIGIDIEGRETVVVGGGAVAVRKVETLLRCGARVTVVAPRFKDEVEQWERDGRLVLRRKGYEAADVEGAMLVIASTDDRGVNEAVASDCRARGIPVNVADAPELGTFIVPAVIERGSLQVTVSTGGASPLLARVIKEELNRIMAPEYAELAEILGSLREEAKISPSLPQADDRRRFFDSIVASPFLELLRSGQRREAYETIVHACQAAGVPLSDRVRTGLEVTVK